MTIHALILRERGVTRSSRLWRRNRICQSESKGDEYEEGGEVLHFSLIGTTFLLLDGLEIGEKNVCGSAGDEIKVN